MPIRGVQERNAPNTEIDWIDVYREHRSRKMLLTLLNSNPFKDANIECDPEGL